MRRLLVVAACLALAACGGPDTEKPHKTSTTVPGPSGPPDTDPVQQSAPPPSGFPGPPSTLPPASGDKQQRFLDDLRRSGLAVSPNGETELPVADWVCKAKGTGKSDQEIRTYVLAIAGATGAQNPESVADAWIKTAEQSYCQQ